MSAPESQDPDFRVPGAWLAQASKAADELLAKQVPEQGGGSPSVSMSSLDPADRLVGQEVRLAPRSRRGGSSGLIVLIVLGCIFAMALAAVIAIPPDLALYESWPQSTGDRTSEPLTSATTPMRSEAGTPKLIVEPSLGVAGKPAPIGLALRGPANDAVVLIRGLVPGMELSTGVVVAGDTWQLSARDLPYTWIAPPQDFVGSVELIAELRLPNAEVADRQILHVEWMRSSGGPGHDRVRDGTVLDNGSAPAAVSRRHLQRKGISVSALSPAPKSSERFDHLDRCEEDPGPRSIKPPALRGRVLPALRPAHTVFRRASGIRPVSVMGRNALDPFGQQITGSRMADVADC